MRDLSLRVEKAEKDASKANHRESMPFEDDAAFGIVAGTDAGTDSCRRNVNCTIPR